MKYGSFQTNRSSRHMRFAILVQYSRRQDSSYSTGFLVAQKVMLDHGPMVDHPSIPSIDLFGSQPLACRLILQSGTCSSVEQPWRSTVLKSLGQSRRVRWLVEVDHYIAVLESELRQIFCQYHSKDKTNVASIKPYGPGLRSRCALSSSSLWCLL